MAKDAARLREGRIGPAGEEGEAEDAERRAAEMAGEGQFRKEKRNVEERREESRPRRQMIPLSLSAVFTSPRSVSIL